MSAISLTYKLFARYHFMFQFISNYSDEKERFELIFKEGKRLLFATCAC